MSEVLDILKTVSAKSVGLNPFDTSSRYRSLTNSASEKTVRPAVFRARRFHEDPRRELRILAATPSRIAPNIRDERAGGTNNRNSAHPSAGPPSQEALGVATIRQAPPPCTAPPAAPASARQARTAPHPPPAATPRIRFSSCPKLLLGERDQRRRLFQFSPPAAIAQSGLIAPAAPDEKPVARIEHMENPRRPERLAMPGLPGRFPGSQQHVILLRKSQSLSKPSHRICVDWTGWRPPMFTPGGMTVAPVFGSMPH